MYIIKQSGFISCYFSISINLGSELREIQKQIQNLPDPTDPQSVVDLLTLRRDVMFLEFDTAVRNSMADTFLSTGNLQAFKVWKRNLFFAFI